MVKYYNGVENNLDQKHIRNLENLNRRANDLTAQFALNKNKLNTCEYWDLYDLVEDLRTQLQTITNLPKYLRSSRTNSNYRNSFGFTHTMGAQQTFEDISGGILRDTAPDDDWVKISLDNDLLEHQWDIDGGTQLNLFKERFVGGFVKSVVDVMVGEKIYGLDIYKRLTYENNDLKVLSHKETVFQSVEILSQLKKGDIPEFPSMGINASIFIGGNLRGLAYPVVIREMAKTFSTHDLFFDFEVTEISYKDGDLKINFKIKTKYQLLVEKTVVV